MKNCFAVLATVAVMALSVNAGFAADMPKPEDMPKPTAEHAWLQQLVGNWDAKVEALMDPTQPAVVSHGSETVHPVGGFWVQSESTGDMMGAPFHGEMTLGFDPEKQKYVGTWIDSMTSKLWTYEGTVDKSGKVLTLESRGSCPMMPGKVFNFRDVTELTGPDSKRFTSSMQGEDGQWMTMMTINYSRQK